MKWFKVSLATVCVLYGLYLVKSSLGINLSQRYHAWDFLKLPIKSRLH